MAMGETERMMLPAQHESAEIGLAVATTSAALALTVLGILALAKIYPLMLTSIAVVVAGMLVATESADLSRQIALQLAAETARHIDPSPLRAGLNAGVWGGFIGLVLGILAILSVAPATLVAVAAIIFGAALAFEFVARSQARALRMTSRDTPEQSAKLALAIAASTGTAAPFTGVALITLGILALAGLASEVLIAAAVLGLGAYTLLEQVAPAEYLMRLIGQ